MKAVMEVGPVLGMRGACRALEVSPASIYRDLKPKSVSPRMKRRSPRALTESERARIIEVCNSPEFVDRSPQAIVHTLLDRGEHIASSRSFYRVLHDAGSVKERRALARHPQHAIPRLMATAPNQVWSWDITRLRSSFETFFLYLILDIFSRFVVGWTLSPTENSGNATRLIEESLLTWRIAPGSLIIHSDRGAPMTAKSTRDLLDRLGAAPSYSRPRVSNDNPFSESQFKTIKYSPHYPHRFGSFDDARAQIKSILDWYSYDHRHSALGFLTPAQVHFRLDAHVLQARAETLRSAFERHPERFVRGCPKPARPQPVVWINPPTPTPTLSREVLPNFTHPVSQTC
jgi:putative transposase